MAVPAELSDQIVHLLDIKIVKKLGGTDDDIELLKGLIFYKKVSHAAGGPTRMENAKIAVIQFQISPPKTDIEQSIVVSDYTQMDRILKEERNYILDMIKKIKATGCNVLLIQRTNIEHFRAEKFEFADLVEEVSLGDGKIVKITGVKDMGKTTSVFVRGSNQLVLDEAERSLHDALCVVRCFVSTRFLIAGGGGPEIELARQFGAWAKVLHGMEGYCVKSFAEGLQVIPYTFAENAGLSPILVVTELRNKHAQHESNFPGHIENDLKINNTVTVR
ncbi:hypothetical protein ACFE04_007182 [Oxalis oulophora]